MRLIYQEAPAKGWWGYNLPKMNWLEDKLRNIFEPKRVQLFSLGPRASGSMSDDPNTEFTVSLSMVSGLFITYQGSWINLVMSKYLKRSCCLMLKRKSLCNGCFSKTCPQTQRRYSYFFEQPKILFPVIFSKLIKIVIHLIIIKTILDFLKIFLTFTDIRRTLLLIWTQLWEALLKDVSCKKNVTFWLI